MNPCKGPTTPAANHQSRRWLQFNRLSPELRTCAVTAAIATLFLFLNLGHYPLWDDESLVALSAKGVLQTGDTSAEVGHNIVAYREGILLVDLKDRGLPPLGAYLTALSFAVFGESAWAARLPFASIGLLTVLLMLHWARKADLNQWHLVVFCVILLANTSFFLFCRQCRYYSLVMALTTLLGWLYVRWPYGRWNSGLMGIVSGLLFCAHSLAFVVVMLALGLDYISWGRHEKRLGWSAIALFLIPQALIIASVLSVWNPLATAFGRYATANSLIDRCRLLVWHLRDIVQCEFVSLPVIGAACWLAVKRRDKVLARCLVATAVMLSVMAFISPQIVGETAVADVRYVTPVIPVGLIIGTRTIWVLARGSVVIAGLMLLPTYIFNLGNGGPLLWCGVRSTPQAFVQELFEPIADPYTPSIKWLQQFVGEKATVWVVPGYCTYPLMFHAPRPLYAWQLTQADGQFRNVDDAHVRGKVLPEYIVCFGPVVADIAVLLDRWKLAGVSYRPAAKMTDFWKDMYRPELFWRSFKTIRPHEERNECIYVFRRQYGP